MAYVGQGIKGGTFSVLDTSGNTYNGSNVTFDLGTHVSSPAQLIVSHDGVIQKPVTDYTLATGGTQITFTTAPASGASIFITEISGAVGAPMNRDINGDELILDADADTSITADTDDQIDVRVGGTDQITIKDGALSPVTDNDIDLGTSSLEFKDAYFDGTVTSDAGLFDTLGVTSAKDLGTGIHIKTADSGGDVATNADELVIEGSGSAGMTILSGNDDNCLIHFGDDGDNDIGIIKYRHDNNSMRFTTNASERMTITDDGDIGVGNTDPGTARFNVQKNSDQLYYGKNDSSGQFQVTSAGVISATNTTVQSISDERLKKDIADFSGGLDIIKAMRPRTYKWKNPQYHNDKDDTQYGFVAQELLTISNAEKLNLVVVDDANTMMYENEKDLLPDGKANISGYQERDAIYVSAIKELLTKIETLETKVKALEDA
jgi:hypothetical protein